ncbi:DsrE family protein [Flagellimonas crocea]|uniref:DsrE family protein n=1 Tax=Flagellimonas crocea TaxID=3067311 RepID=UPI00296F9803|nr:DsrE family protein [Muricauda sp. DH64]
MKLFRNIFLLGLLSILTVPTVFGQDTLNAEIVSNLQETKKYAFGVSEERHFRGVLSMYDKLVASGVEVTEYEIVTKGKLVTQLVKGSDLETLYQKYKNKVRVSVCSVAMEKLGVTADQLIPGMEPVATWSLRILHLQAKGYNTLMY